MYAVKILVCVIACGEKVQESVSFLIFWLLQKVFWGSLQSLLLPVCIDEYLYISTLCFCIFTYLLRRDMISVAGEL